MRGPIKSELLELLGRDVAQGAVGSNGIVILSPRLNVCLAWPRLRALQRLGVCLHEIQPARLIYPIDGPTSGYYHRHPDPVVPVWWRVEEIAPSVVRAIARYRGAGG